MFRRFRPSSRRRVAPALAVVALAAVGVTLSAQQQIVPGTNVNMVSGTTYPDGDPYLQRQNEPSGGVSTRNPLHILVGANDYRTVDIPGPFDPLRGFKMNADAWVGLFRSLDGGETWKSTLLPGYPQDVSPEGLASPIKGREAATDPVMKSGTNGMFYYAGVAFDRGENKPSAIFMARYMDLNNLEAGNPIGYVDTRIVDADSGTRFLDKVAVATDIPRTAATCSMTARQDNGTTHVQTIPAGNVYVAYAAFTGSGATEQSVIMFTRSTNCGATWSTPRALSTGNRLVQNPQIAVNPVDGSVYVSWRRFKYLTQDDAVMVIKSIDGGATFGKVLRVSGVRPFDQGTTPTSFRSNGFQTMAIDATGRVYLAWPDRGYAPLRPDPVSGDSRIVISTSAAGATWTVPRPVQTEGVGHQLMPALTFHGGKLRLLYYDLREDVSQLFGPYIDELPILTGPAPRIRHTIDVFVGQALPGNAPVFTTARVSDYAFGFMPGSTVEERLQFNPPNLPLFRQGAVPFMGDYIDMAPAPPFVLNDAGVWVYNTGAAGSTVSHAFWADNRDVRAPADGNWANYTPVTSDAVGSQSRFDPNLPVPSCVPGQVGMRNQNIYTARVTDGLFVSAPGNNKSFNGFQRAFVVVAENATSAVRTYRFTIENQPVGGQASFLQFGPALTTLDVTTPILSSVARTVFVTAQDEDARIRVSIAEVTAPGGVPVAGGLAGSVVLNPDPSNPSLQNPSLQNPSLQNIAVAEQYNPGITSARVGVPSLQNPSFQNPTFQNPSLQNPSIQNPFLQDPSLQNPSLQNPTLQNDAVANPSIVNAGIPNPSLQNPSLQNPSLQNPSLQNVDLTNAGFSDTSWVITNEGNTTASYTVNLLLNDPVPTGFATQLLLHKTFKTPAADGCTLKEQAHTILLANIPNPQFVTDPTNPSLQNPSLQNPSLQNPTLALAPGETATITFRVVDPNIFDGVTYDASGAVTPAAVAQSINTEDAGGPNPEAERPVAMPLTITTTTIEPTTPGAPINRTLQSVAGSGPLTCSVLSGQMPPGVTLSPTGTIAGTPTTPGNYVFTVRCVDANGKADEQTLSMQINPAAPVSFDALWNGADANWYNPANWSPRGVPTATARVYISAATTLFPRLTADATVRDLFLEPGATLDSNGFTLTVTNNADAGHTIIGAGRTVLTGDGGTASGVFANLEIQGRIILSAPVTTTGTLTLGAGSRLELNGQPLIVGGQLVTSVTEGALPVVVGAAANNLFLVAGVNVDGLVINGAPLTINAGALTRFDNVSFSGFGPDEVQLTVNNPGLVTHFPMNGLSFASAPTTGQLVQANDTLDAGPTLILDILGSVPGDGSTHTATSGGAVVNWLPNPGEANLAVTQTVAPVPSQAGTRLNYTITVTNGGPAGAVGVTLIPGVPFGATGVTATATQGTCAVGSGGWSCALGDLASGAVVRADVSFIPGTTGTLFTTASVSSQTPDSVIANNFHTIAASIVPAGQGVDLALTKADSIDPVGLNQPFTYTLVAANHGTTVATNVVVTDNVPAGVNITQATSASGMCSAISSQVICSFASLAPGESATMTFTAVGTAVGIVTNQASVTSTEVELTPADNVASQVTAVVASAACTLPTFSGPILFTANGRTGDVLVGDLNGDGFKDIVAPLPAANSVAVLLGNGTGSFGPPTLFPSGVGTHEGVILDLNGDGRLDIALEGLSDAFVLFGDGGGGFGSPVTYSFAPGIVGDVRAADFNGDGRPDLAIPVGQPNELHILLNNGSGGFVDTTTIALPGVPDRVAIQDVTGDGRADLLLSYVPTDAGLPANVVSVLIGDGAGGFGAPGAIPLQAGSQSRVFAVGDVNGDSRRDLAIVEILPTGRRILLAFGDGAGGFSVQELIGALPGAFRVVAGDVNADGNPDLAISTGGIVYVSLGDGVGGFGALTPFSTPFGLQFDLADLNGDGRPDIVSALNQGDGVAVLLNGCGQQAGNLVLTATDTPDPVAEGGMLTYLATVTNAGSVLASQVTLTETLSSLGAAGTVTSSQGACTITGRLVSCALGAIAPGASADVQVTFTPSAATASLGNTIGVGSELADANPTNNVVTLTTTITAAGPPSADLSLTMSDSLDPVPFGQAFTYVLVAQNAGPVPATGVTVTDTVPAGLSIASALTTQGSCTVVNQTVSCALGALPADASATITINVTGLAAATVSNTASISGDQLDPVAASNSDTEQTTIALASCSVVTFTGPTPYAGSPGPTAVVRLVDMNHDGNLDAVATHETNPGGVDVFLGDGAGHFGAPRFTSTVTGPWLHVVADFNGDTHPDVIVATDRTAFGNPITLRLLTNDGTGTLTLSPTFSIPFGGHLSAVDIDRDGDQDLVIAADSDLALLRNDGVGNFGEPETLLANAGGFATFGDFNGDNRTDVVTGLGSEGFAVILADANGGFLPAVIHPIAGGAHAVADPADLNADGRLDLLIIPGDGEGPSQGANVVFGDGAGGFGGLVQASDQFMYFPTLTDVNADGRLDLVAISSLASIGVWSGNGGGTFSAPVQFPNAVYYGPTVGDLNGDGRPDIVTGDINGTLNVFLNNCGAAPANLTVALTESADPVNEGDELTYTVTVTNQTGVAASGVRLNSVLSRIVDGDPVPPNAAVLGVTSTAGGTLRTTGFTYTWTLATLAANDTATFTFRFRPLTGGPLQFATGVASEGAETDPADNAASETTAVTPLGVTLLVTTTADSGPGSLRQAVLDSNADSGDRDTIAFNIPVAGVPTITLLSTLGFISEPVVIDGTTQPTTARVELTGNGLAATGLVIGGGNSIVRGMVINRFGGDAISLDSNGGNVVEGNFIGTDSTGTLARPNGTGGVRVFTSGNRIGGLTAAARNVISGNTATGLVLQNSTATGNVVQGNSIGVTAAGLAALPNSNGGVAIFGGASANTIGGAVSGAGNLISGNTGVGINVTSGSNGNIIQGNFIGLDAAGTFDLGNTGDGISLSGVSGTIVGGNTAAARNVVSGNNSVGVRINGATATGNAIRGNYVGVNAAGGAAVGNTNGGITVQNGASSNTIGGTGIGESNVISGNFLNGVNLTTTASGNTIQGNFIGVDAAGGADLGNSGDGINIAGVSGTIVGGSTAAARNVVSGNNNVGIRINGVTATGNVIRGNYIGVNAAGGTAVGNTNGGITVLNSASSNTIGGSGAGEGNVISGNNQHGILVQTAANGNTIQGNLIGLNAAGSQALANTTHGIDLNGVSATIVGGTAAGAGNVISGNAAYGIRNAAGSTGTVVLGNRIGTNAAGSGPVPNSLSGLFVDGNGTTIGGTAAGAANIIAHNALNGANVVGGTGHVMVGNSFFSNGELGINLGPPGVTANDVGDGDAGANNHQNFPVLTGVAGGVQGTLNSTANTAFTVQYYSNAACDSSGNGEGATFLGEVSVITNADGNVTLPLFNVASGAIVTATATSGTNDTSEFSACVTIPGAATIDATDSSAAELGGDTATLTISRAVGEALTAERVVMGTVTGTAVAYDDYTLSGPGVVGYSSTHFQVRIPAGETSVTMTLTPAVDELSEGTEFATFTAEGTSATVAIVDVPSVRTWISDTGGNWEDANNWSDGVVPQPGELVIIDGDFTVTLSTGSVAIGQLDSSAHIAISGGSLAIDGAANFFGGLTLSGGTIGGTGTIVLDGISLWTGGQMSGSGQTVVSGTLTVSSVSPGSLVRTISNQGMLIWDQPSLTQQDGAGIINLTNGTLEIPGNLSIAGGFLTNFGTLFKSGAPGPLSLGGTVFVNSGLLRLRLGATSDTVNSNGPVQIGGSLELVLQPGFDPADGSQFELLSYTSLNGTFQNVFGERRLYDAAYGSTVFTVVANRGLVTPLSLGGFSANAQIETFTPNFGQQAPPVTFNGLTYSSPGAQLQSDTTWDGFYPSWPTASEGFGLNDLVGQTELQIDFSTPVRRVGMFAVTGFKTTFILKAYDDNLTLIGTTSGTMPDFTDAAFVGLESSVNIRRVVLTEPYDNGQISIVDDIRYEGSANQRPIANSGADQSVTAGSTVQLNGTGSSDPEGQGLTYLWSFVSRPAGSTATLQNAATATPTFVPDLPGDYVIRLIVNDGALNSDPDEIEIHTNGPPVADAGPDQTVPVGSTVQLDGISSTDPEGSSLTYHWILNSRPATSAATLSSADIRNPVFVADAAGIYIAQLVVNDGLVNSSSDLVVIRTQNRAPVANAGADVQNVPLETPVSLDGSASTDPDGDALTYSWAFVQRPTGSTAILLNGNSASPSFTVDRPGRYRVRLTVNDGQVPGTDDVDVTTVNVPPVADAGPDQTVQEGDLVRLTGGGSSDQNGNELSYRWSFVSRPPGSTAQLSATDVVGPTFTADVAGIYTLQLIVNDTIVDGPPDAVTVTALSTNITLALVDTPLVGVGTQAGLRVLLPFAAPAGGVTVSLTSDDTRVVTVTPATVTVATGASEGQVAVNGVSVGTTELRATAPGYSDGALTISVTNSVLSVPATLNVPLGATASLPVSISSPAPAGGLNVSLVSSNSAAVELQSPAITIPAGAVAANATVIGRSGGSSTIVASSPNFASASAQATTQGNLNITVTSLQIRPGFPGTITVQLQSAGNPVAAPAPGVSISFTPGAPGCASIAAATIPTGLTTTTSSVTYGGSATLPCTTTVVASAPGLTGDSISVTVNPDPGITLFSLPGLVGAGLMDGVYTARLGESNHGGVTLRITSSDPNLVLVSRNATTAGTAFVDIPVANGSIDAGYYIHGVEGARGSVTLTATATGFSQAQNSATVAESALQLQGVPGTTTSLSADTPFYVSVGVLNASGIIAQFQQLRAGAASVSVTVSHTNTGAATLITTAGAGQTRTVTIAPGAINSPTSVATGGVALDPLAAGSTTVSATASGFRAATPVSVTVSAPGITLFSLPGLVGAGLMDGVYTARLGASAHGGVTVRITSSDPNLVLVSRNATTAGTAFVDIPVANGSIDAGYYIHGVEGARGSVTLTATATGFNQAQNSATVAESALQLQGVPGTTTSLSADTPFYVSVGVLNASGIIAQFQQRRAGAASVSVTVSHTNPAVAQLVTTGGTGQTRTVAIAPGSLNSPTSVATGGVAFDPIGGGSTTVTATATGFRTATPVSVTVDAPGITLFSLPGLVGAGLMDGVYTARLGATAHGGVTVRITSSNPDVLRVSSNATTAGAAFVDIPIANGSIDAGYYIHGVEGARGTVTLTATAPGFTQAQGSATVEESGLQLQAVPGTTTTLSADTPFYVSLGVLNASGLIAQFQQLRAGATSVSVTVSHTNPAVAQLVTTGGTGQTRTVAIAAGSIHSPTSVTTGGVAFNPIGGGSTIVTATAPGFRASPSVNVTVTAPGITLFSLPGVIGAGLQETNHTARLGATAHGGVSLRITSSDPSVLLVSRDPTTTGTAFVDIPVANGSTDATYYLQGIRDALGRVTVTASATGFIPEQSTVDVVAPALQIEALPASISATGSSVAFYVRVGISNAFDTALSRFQEVAPGPALVATLTNSTSAVAQLVTTAGGAQSRTVLIPAGASFSPTTLAAGGIEFDPLSGGATIVTASIPGVVTTDAGRVEISVSAGSVTGQSTEPSGGRRPPRK